jgi:capsular exopolysaccharide synthesis family protein
MFDLTSTGANGRPPAPIEPRRGSVDAPIGNVDGGPDWRRAIMALRRHVWLILLATILSGGAGWYASRLIVPQYAARTTIWIDESGRDAGRSPLAPSDLFDAQGWVQLVTSNAVLDTVVARLHLFVSTPNAPVDPKLFAGLTATARIRPGRYVLASDAAGTHYVLRDAAQDQVIETVVVGDSVGRTIGLEWRPPADMASPDASYAFVLRLPHAVAQSLGGALSVGINQQASFLTVGMMGTSPTRTAALLNTIAGRYVELAKSLQHERITQQTSVLSQQVNQASQSLAQAEKELEAFRVRTITLPRDRASGGMPAASDMGGGDPAISRFNGAQSQLSNTRADLATVERLLRAAVDSTATLAGFEGLPVVTQSSSLTAAFKDLDDKQAKLRGLLDRYTDAYPEVVQLRREISQVRRGTIPQIAAGLLDELSRRSSALSGEISQTADSLRLIPQRETAEARLLRNVSMTTSLYNTLQQKYDEALIAQTTSVSDVRILDEAAVPPYPTKNTKSRVILMALVAGFGLASVAAILRDRLDPRFRYPEQISREMGVTILGSVPRTKGTGDGAVTDPAFRDSIRGVRMNLSYAYGAAGPVTFAITSPGGSDGKSFISLHLARTFAEMGRRTILIDGDVRRGVLHRRCHVTRRPGLIDHLNGDVSLDDVIQGTPFPNCFLVPSGTRVNEAPELLGSPAMQRMITELRTRFDVIICDTAPLSAGIDPFLMGAVTGNLMLIIRPGVSLRQVLQTKLEVLDRMPIRLLGAVLNAVPDSAPYLYYSHYLPGYETATERLGQGVSGKQPTGAG